MARNFLSAGWAALAAALAGLSLLGLQFGCAARPHAAAAGLLSMALAAALRLRRRPTTWAYVSAGVWTALAVSTLQTALAVLPAGAAAVLLREGSPRRRLESRAWIPVGLVAAGLVLFWPFLLLPPPEGASSSAFQTEGLSLLASDGWSRDFRGGGFATVLLTLWSYEPLTATLAAGAGLFWLGRAIFRGLRASISPPWAIVASFAVPYAAVLCAFDRTMQRFLLPLIPVLAGAAAWGLCELHCGPRWRKRLACALTCAALAVPALAGWRWIRLRNRDDTLTAAARWLEAHADPTSDRIGLHFAHDLPLVRTSEGLFEPDGRLREDVYGYWAEYQQRWLASAPAWGGTAWNLVPIFSPGKLPHAGIVADPGAYFRGLGLDYVLLPAATETGMSPDLERVRAWAAAHLERVAALPAAPLAPLSWGSASLQEPPFLWNALRARELGEAWELYRVP